MAADKPAIPMDLDCAVMWLYSEHGVGEEGLTEKIFNGDQLTDRERAFAYDLITENNSHFKTAGIIPPTQVITLEDVTEGDGKKVRFSPTLAAEAVLRTMHVAMSKDSEDIYIFDATKGVYLPDGARIIDLTLCEAATDLFNDYQKRETLRRVRNALLEHPVKFDPDPYTLSVKNGVINLLTGEFRKYRAEDLITDQIQVLFDPEAKCPAFLAFLESITPNISDRITLIDWFVATAVREPLPYVLFLLGLGRNGKGIYEKLIKKFFGQASFRDMPLQEVTKNNFAAGGFYRKRGWIASETGKTKAHIGTDFIKLTSGNGVIDGDRKNQSRIQFEPYFQTIVDTNTMPKIEDNSIGWQERFVKVDLPFIFVANPDPDNPLEKTRDPNLFDKLSTPVELSGILNLLIFRSQFIGTSKTIWKRAGAAMFTEYNEQSSSVATFLDEFCEYDGNLSNLWTPSKTIYKAYCEWCNYKVGEVVDNAHFGRQLKKFCGGSAPKQGKDKDRKTQTEYKGLIFNKESYEKEFKKLQDAVSETCLKKSEVLSEEENSQQIAMSEVSEVNIWIKVIEKFN
jgi:putative DNA primase/helicase